MDSRWDLFDSSLKCLFVGTKMIFTNDEQNPSITEITYGSGGVVVAVISSFLCEIFWLQIAGMPLQVTYARGSVIYMCACLSTDLHSPDLSPVSLNTEAVGTSPLYPLTSIFTSPLETE